MRTDLTEEQQAASDRLADLLAQWWESESGQDSYTHEWCDVADNVVAAASAYGEWEIKRGA